jgi:hypothetical protein
MSDNTTIPTMENDLINSSYNFMIAYAGVPVGILGVMLCINGLQKDSAFVGEKVIGGALSMTFSVLYQAGLIDPFLVDDTTQVDFVDVA